MGFGLVIEFIDLLIVTTDNYNSLAELHTSNITATRAYKMSSGKTVLRLRPYKSGTYPAA
jgi:hypothetical protein